MENMNYVLVDESGEPLSINQVPVYKPEDIIKKLKTAKPILYNKVVIPLDTARTGQRDEEFSFYGDFLAVIDISGAATADIVFNEPDRDSIPVSDHLRISTPFYRFFVINTAQVGETLTLLVGRESLFTIRW